MNSSRRTILLSGLVAVLATTATGQPFQNVAGAASGITLPGNYGSNLGRGGCFGDFDGDGDQDLLFPPGSGQTILHYRNDGGGTFTDISGTTGLGAPIRPHATIAADVDNDGDLDFFVAGNYEANQLYINNGFGFFTDEAAARGLDFPSSGAYTGSFGDYDRDGWIDLYIGNYLGPVGVGQANQLMRNTGNGFFVDVTANAGVGNTGLCFTGVFHDYNDDGWPDIFVGNDKGWYPGQQPDTTYRNNGNGTFTDVGVAINTRFAIGAMGSDFTDAFNDGGWDIYVSNTSAGHLFHVWNPATQQYDELASTYGVSAFQEGWATNFLDYDNDGWQDLYVVHSYLPNYMYKNPGAAGGTWTDLAPTLGCNIGNTLKYVSIIGDYDNDGRMDLVMPIPGGTGFVLRNTVVGGAWIKFKLEGTVSNRSGIGARVSVTTSGVTQRQTLRTGHGYLGGHDLRLHFGLGASAAADTVRIIWPSGQDQTLTGLAANQEHLIVEPALSLVGTPLPGSAVGPAITSPNEPGASFQVALAAGTAQGFLLPDGRPVPLDPDWLFQLTTMPANGLLNPTTGTLDPAGYGTTVLNIPNIPSLTGLTFHAAVGTGNPSAPLGIASIAGPLAITVQ